MTALTGCSIIGGVAVKEGSRPFHAIDPKSGQTFPPEYRAASDEEVDRACRLAAEAYEVFGRTTPATRAALLRDIAAGMEGASDAILARCEAETSLPQARVTAELGRTCKQLRLFADLIEEGSWVDARINTGDPNRTPPAPDVRSMRQSLGPVVVFGASNFPLAFSTAGGDTASALAAGNPVIVKAHVGHPGTNELVGRIIADAVERAGLPAGTFSLVFGEGAKVGQALVRHPAIKAVGFTGSQGGGVALMKAAAARPVPILVYAEMGSVNPFVIFEGALRKNAASIAEGLHGSFTLGVGQFCTNPGLVFVPEGRTGDDFVGLLAERTRTTAAGAMLTPSIGAAYRDGLSTMQQHGAARVAGGNEGTASMCGEAAVWQVDASRVTEEPRLLEEVFGPSTLIVRYRDTEQLDRVIRNLEGQLTATVHALPEELQQNEELVRQLGRRAGRVIFNQFPTGVEVNHAMVHGGPFPATSDGRSTSVGTRAIERFTRYLAYQNWPDEALPEELRNDNPRKIWRLVNGAWTRDAVA